MQPNRGEIESKFVAASSKPSRACKKPETALSVRLRSWRYTPIPPTMLEGRILLVDDFAPWRRAVSSMLEVHKGLEIVGEATDGPEAVQKARALKPDLVLLDIGLPVLNGLEAATQISDVAPEAKILFVSQNNDKEVVSAALGDGGRGYVLKVDAKSELMAAVSAVLQGERFVSRQVKR